MTIDAKTHRVIDNSFGHGHLCEIAVAGGALDFRSKVRRMIETNVRLFKESIHALPGQVFSPLRKIAKFDDPRILFIADIGVTSHADIHAWNSRNRTLRDTQMAVGAGHSNVFRMNLVRKIERLHRLRANAEKVPGGIRERWMCRRENGRTPSARLIGIRLADGNRFDVRLRTATKDD